MASAAWRACAQRACPPEPPRVVDTRRGRGALVVRANDQGQDAYNKAMAEYSKTPFEYRHELGLCE